MAQKTNTQITLSPSQIQERDALCEKYPILSKYIQHCFANGEVEVLNHFLDGLDLGDISTIDS